MPDKLNSLKKKRGSRMGLYQNNNELNEYFLTFQEGIKKITDSLTNIINVNKNHSKPQEDIKDLFNSIMETVNKISDSLKNRHIINDEYYDFVEIGFLIENALKTKEKREEKLEIILKILDEFSKINNIKFRLLEEYNIDDLSVNKLPTDLKERFKKHYEDFDKFFFDCKVDYHALEGEMENPIIDEFFKTIDEDVIFNRKISSN